MGTGERRGSGGNALPIISVSPLVTGVGDRRAVASQIAGACRDQGFFYIVDHGVDRDLQQRLGQLSRAFFELDLDRKMRIRMALAGRAWRGYFPVGGELTSGKPDIKEGLYFGAELPDSDPRVAAGLPLHGPNLFPPEMPGFRDVVLAYMAAVTRLGHRLVEGLAMSLGLESHYFDRWMSDPVILFRIFHYPPIARTPESEPSWGVGEHTDYGLLTILKQDETGGLEVKSGGRWIAAPPIANSFVCNIGDMLERMTSGHYRSTPHRVRNPTSRSRLSFPFFFDPSFDARVEAIKVNADSKSPPRSNERWDRANVHAFEGTYGEYLLEKVSKVFPDLAD